MWAFLWHMVQTLVIMYVIISYVLCYAAFFRTDNEKMNEVPIYGKVILWVLSPLILADALFTRAFRGGEDKAGQ